MTQPQTVRDYEELGLSKLWKFPTMYYMRGADDEQTARDSESAFQRYRLRPRILRGISSISKRCTVLGHEINFPICLAPTACCRFAHVEKEIGTCKAARKLRTLMVHSCASTTRIGELMEAVPGALVWQQLYLFKNKLLTQQMVKEAEASGVKAFVITVDAAGGCNRRISPTTEGSTVLAGNIDFKLLNFEITTPDCAGFKQMGDQNLWAYCAHQCQESSNSIEDLRWIRSITTLPIIVKGIITGKDARRVIDDGIASAIIVSAHGGRQLDGIPAPIDALGEVLEAVRSTGSSTEVYMDGGVRSGSDVFKALAAGAKAVFIGRPALWALAANGSDGVAHLLEIFREELHDVMAQCGCATLEDITPSSVIHESKYLARLEP